MNVNKDDDSGSNHEKEECGEFKVDIGTDNWPAEITWDVMNKLGGIVALSVQCTECL